MFGHLNESVAVVTALEICNFGKRECSSILAQAPQPQNGQDLLTAILSAFTAIFQVNLG